MARFAVRFRNVEAIVGGPRCCIVGGPCLDSGRQVIPTLDFFAQPLRFVGGPCIRRGAPQARINRIGVGQVRRLDAFAVLADQLGIFFEAADVEAACGVDEMAGVFLLPWPMYLVTL